MLNPDKLTAWLVLAVVLIALVLVLWPRNTKRVKVERLIEPDEWKD